MTDEELVELGTGPAATVYGGGAVALKVYPSTVDEEVLEAFEREQARLAPVRARSPILPVDELVELPDGRHALRMRLCETSLAELVAGGGPLEVADALAVGYDVAVAVAAAHRVGVVHGGLTPHNVLIHPSGAPLVADFGVAFREAFPVVDAEYAAPETLLSGARDFSADLYGIGTVLFLALSGESPEPSPAGTVEFPYREDVPAELARLVVRLLAGRPEYRPATAGVVVTQLAEMLDTLDEPSDPPVVVPEKRRTRLGAIAGIAAGAAVLGAGVVLASTLWSDDQPLAAPVVAMAPTFTLADPADQGTHVDLTWTAPQGMTFAVVVAVENEQAKILAAHQNRTMRVATDPVRKYCFLVQATDGVQDMETAAKPIRGAVCRN